MDVSAARGLPHAGGRSSTVEACNRESGLREVALIDGPNTKTGMLSARAQLPSDGTDKSAADLWIAGFLAARLQMNSAEGPTLMARVLRTAHA